MRDVFEIYLKSNGFSNATKNIVLKALYTMKNKILHKSEQKWRKSRKHVQKCNVSAIFNKTSNLFDDILDRYEY